MGATFLPGLQLAGQFYADVVQPLLAGLYPGLRYSAALLAAAAAHNRLGLTAPVPATMRPFWDRPYLVLDSGQFTAALHEATQDPAIRALPMTGAVDQFTDSTDAQSDTATLRAAVAALLHPASPSAR